MSAFVVAVFCVVMIENNVGTNNTKDIKQTFATPTTTTINGPMTAILLSTKSQERRSTRMLTG